MRRQIIIGELVILPILPLQVESVERFPALLQLGLQAPIAVGDDEPERLMRGCLLEACLELQRPGQRQAAEADIDDMGLSAELHPQKHVAAGRDGVISLYPEHACGKARDLEADGAQRLAEQQILLEAPAAATALDHLALQCLYVEIDRQAKIRVQVLEWDGGGMALGEPLQRLRRDEGRSRKTDASEIRVEIE
jgi:hypothetical protein